MKIDWDKYSLEAGVAGTAEIDILEDNEGNPILVEYNLNDFEPEKYTSVHVYLVDEQETEGALVGSVSGSFTSDEDLIMEATKIIEAYEMKQLKEDPKDEINVKIDADGFKVTARYKGETYEENWVRDNAGEHTVGPGISSQGMNEEMAEAIDALTSGASEVFNKLKENGEDI